MPPKAMNSGSMATKAEEGQSRPPKKRLAQPVAAISPPPAKKKKETLDQGNGTQIQAKAQAVATAGAPKAVPKGAPVGVPKGGTKTASNGPLVTAHKPPPSATAQVMPSKACAQGEKTHAAMKAAFRRTIPGQDVDPRVQAGAAGSRGAKVVKMPLHVVEAIKDKRWGGYVVPEVQRARRRMCKLRRF